MGEEEEEIVVGGDDVDVFGDEGIDDVVSFGDPDDHTDVYGDDGVGGDEQEEEEEEQDPYNFEMKDDTEDVNFRRNEEIPEEIHYLPDGSVMKFKQDDGDGNTHHVVPGKTNADDEDDDVEDVDGEEVIDDGLNHEDVEDVVGFGDDDINDSFED